MSTSHRQWKNQAKCVTYTHTHTHLYIYLSQCLASESLLHEYLQITKPFRYQFLSQPLSICMSSKKEKGQHNCWHWYTGEPAQCPNGRSPPLETEVDAEWSNGNKQLRMSFHSVLLPSLLRWLIRTDSSSTEWYEHAALSSGPHLFSLVSLSTMWFWHFNFCSHNLQNSINNRMVKCN